jgi:hypothetical protein
VYQQMVADVEIVVVVHTGIDGNHDLDALVTIELPQNPARPRYVSVAE